MRCLCRASELFRDGTSVSARRERATKMDEHQIRNAKLEKGLRKLTPGVKSRRARSHRESYSRQKSRARAILAYSDSAPPSFFFRNF